VIVLAVLLVGGVGAAGVVQQGRMDSTCPAFDLTGRPVVKVVADAGETRCVFKRRKDADECPTNTPKGWTVVGKIDGPKNKDKVSCVYHDLGGAE
jgi:hypothetical protein